MHFRQWDLWWVGMGQKKHLEETGNVWNYHSSYCVEDGKNYIKLDSQYRITYYPQLFIPIDNSVL